MQYNTVSLRAIENGFILTTKDGLEFFESKLEDILYRASLELINPQNLQKSNEEEPVIQDIPEQTDKAITETQKGLAMFFDQDMPSKKEKGTVHASKNKICYLCGRPIKVKGETKLIKGKIRDVHLTCGKRSITRCFICDRGLRDGKGIPVNGKGEAHRKCLVKLDLDQNGKEFEWGEKSNDKLLQAGIELIEMQS